MRALVPDYIRQRFEAGDRQGRLHVASLSLDVSGFTAMTEALLAHGKEGAEILATVLHRLFEPIIAAIADHGGFVSGFAGDAITALFPGPPAAAAARLRDATTVIVSAAADRAVQSTKYGDFRLGLKVGGSLGTAEWLIVGDEQRRVFAFRGDALRGAKLAEARARNAPFFDEALTAALAGAPEVPTAPIRAPATSASSLPDFFPDSLWRRASQGEFREVVSVFVRNESPGERGEDFVQGVVQRAHRFGGTFGTLDTDGTHDVAVVFFGAPTAHEDDPQRALRMASSLRARLRDGGVEVSVGVSRGTVYAGFVGAPPSEKFDCLGSSVNLAARLMASAAPGQVLVSGEMARTPGFEFTEEPPARMKGFTEPVRRHRLVGRATRDRGFRRPLIGRDSSLAALRGWADRALADSLPALAFVSGDAGMGKSHLAYCLEQYVGPDVTRLVGQSDPVLRSAFKPFAQVLRRSFGQDRNAATATNQRRFEARHRALIAQTRALPAGHTLALELRRTRPYLARLLDLSDHETVYDLVDARGVFDNTLLALATVLQAERQRRPVLVLLEDGHWFDDATWTLLGLLKRQRAAHALLFVVTSREGVAARVERLRWPERRLATVELRPFDRAATSALAEDLLDAPVDDSLVSFLEEKAQGVPFFAQQLVAHLQESELLRTDDGGPVRLADDRAAIPPNLNSLLVARLDRLSEEVRDVVQTAAVLGLEFEVRLLSKMLGRDATQAVVAAEQERVWALIGELRYIFRHALLRDAAYEMQLRERLSGLHRLAGDCLTQVYGADSARHVGRLAHHYEEAWRLGDRGSVLHARTFLDAEAARAFGGFENVRSAECCTRLLAMTPDSEPGRRFAILLRREAAWSAAGRRDEQAEDLLSLSRLAQTLGQEEQLRAALRQAGHAVEVGRYEEAEGHARAASSLADGVSDALAGAEALRDLARALGRSGDYAGAAAALHESLAVSAQVDDQIGEADAHGLLSWIGFMRGDYAESRRHGELGLALEREVGSPRRVCLRLNEVASVAREQGETQVAIAYLREALDSARETGNRSMEGIVQLNLGVLAGRQGDRSEAVRLYRNALEVFRTQQNRRHEGVVLNNLGNVAAKAGALEDALESYEQALAVFRDTGDRQGTGMALLNSAS